jgi:proteasome lid subunit RPN8/RPN11
MAEAAAIAAPGAPARTAALQLPGATVAELGRLARQAYPLEACALLLGPGPGAAAWRCVPLPNVAATPWRGYRVDPRALRDALAAAEATGQAVQGFFHSHPDGVAAPSADDLEACPPWLGWVQLIGALAARGPLHLAAWAVGADGWHRHPLRVGGSLSPTRS